MTNVEFFRVIETFQVVVTAIVNEHANSADLHQYRFPKLMKHLASVREMVAMRSNALEQMRTINDLAADEFGPVDNTGSVTFSVLGKDIPFSHLRLSLMQNYMTTNWSLYDSLSDLSGMDPLKDAPCNEVFQFDRYCFMNSGKVAKHAVFVKLRETYGAYIGLSYAVRNWIVHDGLFSASANRNLFDAEMPAKGDRFIIPEESWHEIRRRVEEVYKTSISKPDIPKDGDVCLLEMFSLLEQHNDHLFAHLIGYTGTLLRLNDLQLNRI